MTSTVTFASLGCWNFGGCDTSSFADRMLGQWEFEKRLKINVWRSRCTWAKWVIRRFTFLVGVVKAVIEAGNLFDR